MKLSIEPRIPPLRSSGMKTLHKCKRMFLWSEIYGLRRGVQTEALRIGTLSHIMLTERYKGANAGEAYAVAVEAVNDERENLATMLRDGILKSGERFESISNQMTLDLQKSYAMVDAFLAYYPISVTQEVLATELFFEVRVPGIKPPIQGQIDLILRNKTTGKLSIVDIKTHGTSTLTRAATNVFDIQTHLFYTVGLQALLNKSAGLSIEPFARLTSEAPNLLRGFKVRDFSTVEYFLLKKPTIKCCGKDDYDVDKYIPRVRTWYDEQTEKNPDDPPFAYSAQGLHVNPLTNPEDMQRLREYAEAATHDPDDLPWFYKTANDMQCSSTFGTCPYLGLCRTDRARGQWSTLIEQTFRQEFRA